MATLKLEHVYKNYRDVKAVIDANWECGDGEIVSILGPSGCGKSSSLRMIAGLESITQGSIYIGDKKVNDLSPGERNIAMAFENYALYPHMNVEQNITYPLRIKKLSKAEIKKRRDEILELLELQDIADFKVTGLSGGQKQRVSLGRALIREPDVLLLDEPISHLDAKLRSKMRYDLKNLIKRTGNTTVYVTHDQLEAITIADRVVVMNFGVVQQIGTPIDIYENPQNKFVAAFIGEPAMNLLSGTLERSNEELFFIKERQRIALPGVYLNEDLFAEETISIGIRPNECSISLQEKKDWMKGIIYTVTMGIDSKTYQVRIDDTDVRVITSLEMEGEIGAPAWVSFDSIKVRFFSDKTGKRINHTSEGLSNE
ncbi:MAG: ABC transporter ATP-binding protein [Candidatus Marinimicrobia bacterium]|nr:ABC transporter ATP-binding protein [Candidatus Neomarinimicrobiota bacterium]